MDVGILVSGHRPAHEAVALARAAEDAGLAEVWLTEDYLERGIFALAGAVAAATQRVNVGLGVVNPFTRHPALIAMETATLAELAPGRVVLGLGASNQHWMTEMLGIDHTRPLAAVGEAHALIRSLLAGERVDADGDRFRVRAQLAFAPTVPVPVHYGVKQQVGLGMAADDADGVVLSVLSSPPYVRWVRQQVGPDLRVSAFVAVSVDDAHPARARDAIRPFVARFLGVHGAQPITLTAGLSAEQAGQFRQGFLTDQPLTSAVTDEMLDQFVVAGDTARARDAVATFRDAGCDCLLVGDQPDVPIDEVIRTAIQLQI